MLHQNWFMDKRFEMFYEYYEEQRFYDTENDCFYQVIEDQPITTIIEYTKDGEDYKEFMDEYLEWKQSKYWKVNKNNDEYYVSPETGYVYEFYDLKGRGDRKNTEIMICMLEYQSENVMLEVENYASNTNSEEPIQQQIVGWQYCTDNCIPKKRMEEMIKEYENKIKFDTDRKE